jgi:predicted permease
MGMGRYWRRADEDAELAREIEAHIAHQIDENVARGMTEEEARRRALVKFGSARNVGEDVWRWNTIGLLDDLWRDVRYVVRTLRRAPGFALAVILVMALGIGSVTAMFTIVRSVLLKPLPFKEPERLVRLYEHSADGNFPYNDSAGGVFEEWKKRSSSFSDLALLRNWPEYNLSAAGGQLPESVRAAECSWNLFPTLGVEPALGRSFTESDDQLSANATVILSWGLWKRRFGSDPSILQQTIHLDAKPYSVIGVMPAWFTYPDQVTQLWTPIHHEEPDRRWQSLDSHMFLAIGRLKPGATEGRGKSELSVIVRRLHDEHLDNPFVSDAANTRPLLEDMVGEIKTPLYVLLAATGCVLLIACLNVANLLVARAAARRKELAIRTALGGSRWRLLGEHLTESFVLSAAGGAAGLLLAAAVIEWLVSTRQDMSRAEAIHIDGGVVAFTVALIFLCATFAGLISSVSATDDKVLSSLQEASRGHTAGRARVGLRRWLLSMEVGLTVVLLIAAGLLVKSYERMRTSNLGCITNNVLTMGFGLPEAQYTQLAQRVSFFETLLARVRSLPGVEGAGLVTGVPGQGYMGDNGFAIAEHPPLPQGQSEYAEVRWADPGYFAAIGIPILRGQTFDPNQRLDRAFKVIVSDSFVRQYFPGKDPLGKHLLTLGNKSYEIVGVVGDTRHLIAKPAGPMMYFPLYSGTENGATLAVRSSVDVNQFALPIQRIVQELDRDLPVAHVLTMDQMIAKSTVDASFDATLLLAFAVLSLVLASVGLYGVLSYLVAQRTSEIGVRMALGAVPGEVLRLTLTDGMRPAMLGLGFGLTAGAAATRLIRDLLYGVQPLDASVFVGVAAILLGVAMAACVLPAWKASRLDPVRALRME